MTRRTERRLGAAIALLIAGAFVAMLAWTWGGWPDPLIDFGRELYVPWQLSAGKVLYRDLAHFNGPLSPYFNALLFRLLGVSLRTLVLVNIAIAAVMTRMIYRLFRASGDRVIATVAALLFVTLFMSMQLVAVGNYNWITPYSHELTHGTALAFALLMATRISSPRARAGVIGLLLGLIFLTKPEVFLAAAAVVVVGWIVRRQRGTGMLLAGLAAPLLLSVALVGARGTLGGWLYVFDARLARLHFYQVTSGFDQPAVNLARAMMQVLAYLAALAPAAVLDRMLRRAPRTPRIVVALVYVLALLLALWRFEARIGWYDAFRGLTPLCLGALLLIRPRVKLRFMLLLFASLLLLKILLAARISHYGFVLAMPAMLCAAALGVSWLPERLRRGAPVSRGPWTLQAATTAALAAIVFIHLRAYQRFYYDKPVIVAEGTADQFRADDLARVTNHLVGILKSFPDTTSAAVVPQGVMVNYLAGRVNPTRYLTLMPPEVLMFGDEAIAAAYRENPPDILVIIGFDLTEYGFAGFDEVAPRTAAFFKANYRLIRRDEPPQLPATVVLQRSR